MTPNLADLRRKAEAATPGPWHVIGRDARLVGAANDHVATAERVYRPGAIADAALARLRGGRP